MHVGDFRNRRESPSESLYRWAIYKHAWTDPWLSARSISIPQHSSSGKIHTIVCQRLLAGMVPIPQYTTVSAFSQSIARTACAWSLSLIGLELLRINAPEMTWFGDVSFASTRDDDRHWTIGSDWHEKGIYFASLSGPFVCVNFYKGC